MDISSNRTPDRLDAMVEACDPVDRSRLTGEVIDDVLDRIGVSITSTERPAARPHRRRRSLRPARTVLLVGAMLAAATATLAVAATRSAHTGLYQPTKRDIAKADPANARRMRSQISMGGPGEFLDPSAPDFRQVALQVASDIPYPSGFDSWRDLLISDEIRMADGATETQGALHGWFAGSAFCAWVQTWRQADLSGNANAASAAAQMIAEAPAWKAVTDEDAHPDATVRGDLGSVQYSLFGWMLPYRDAVLAGDRGRVEHLLATGYGSKCWLGDPAWRSLTREHPEWDSLPPHELARKYEAFLASGGS